MALVEVSGLKKEFGEVSAVNGVDLAIREGELLVILGPSGCGKTTLMRLIAGLEQPTEGHISIAGQDMTDRPPRARGVAMVFQSYALYPHMTVFKNIAFPLKAQSGFTKAEIEEKVRRAAAVLGIEKLLDRKPRQLSGGERQRVALCRAMVKEPSVLLLDEPLSNLDAKLRTSARDELQRFQRRLGITTVFVTHDQIEAMGLGDRIVVMFAGTVRQIGTPEQIYHESGDTFVATFLGSPGMNLLDRGDYTLGFRPEHFRPKGAQPDSIGEAEFTYRVSRVENLGADTLLYGTVDGASEETTVIARIPSTTSLPVDIGASNHFVARSEHLRFFDKRTGKRTAPRPL